MCIRVILEIYEVVWGCWEGKCNNLGDERFKGENFRNNVIFVFENVGEENV